METTKKLYHKLIKTLFKWQQYGTKLALEKRADNSVQDNGTMVVTSF